MTPITAFKHTTGDLLSASYEQNMERLDALRRWYLNDRPTPEDDPRYHS